MPLSEEDRRRLVLGVVTRLRCVECGRYYDPEDFALLHRQSDVWVLSTRCRHCDELCHVVVFLRAEPEPEPIGDLMPEEVDAAQHWTPITVDDVLDVHELLNDFHGDVDSLLAG